MAKQHLGALDGLRGIAAIVVLAHHVRTASGPALLSHDYLAVDFLFLLSGFVIAYAYEEALARGLRVGAFVTARVVRLYPMIVVGVLLGFVLSGSEPRDFDARGALFAQLLFVPAVSGGRILYPLDGVQWSLLLQALANLLHATLLRRLTVPVLAAIAAAGAAATIATARVNHGLDVGGFVATAYGGVARVCFSYPLGVLLYRWHRCGGMPAARLPAWSVALLFVLTLAMLDLTPGANGAKDVLVALVILPVILMLGVHATMNDFQRKAATALADLSYPLYAINLPLVHGSSSGWADGRTAPPPLGGSPAPP